MEEVEDRIGRILNIEGLQPKVIFNLNRVLKRDLRTAQSIATN